jgi:hypothetical protein
MYHHITPQRGASLVETTLSMVLVALVTFTAIQRYRATISAILSRDVVHVLNPLVAGTNLGEAKPLNPVPVVAQPPQLIGGASPVGGVPNIEPARAR